MNLNTLMRTSDRAPSAAGPDFARQISRAAGISFLSPVPSRRALFFCVCLLSVATTPTLAADPIATTCNTADQFTFTDMGTVMDATKVGKPVGTPVADHSLIYLLDGKISMYFFEGANGGVRRAVSSDGLTWDLQSGYVAGLPRAPSPKLTHFKILKLEDGRYRMYVGSNDNISGIHSYISSDGITFAEEQGQRLTNAATGFEYLSWLSIAPKAGGGYRGYFSDLPVGNTAYYQIKSATSVDLVNWTMDSGIRIGPGAATLTGEVHQPFALARANGCVTLFYFKRNYQTGFDVGMYYSTSTDGLIFSTEYYLGIGGGGPDILRLNDGTYLLSYDGGNPTAGFSIGVGKLQLVVDGQTDCLFNWAEKTYPTLFAPAGATSITSAPWYYRYYSKTNAYLGISSVDNHVYYLASNGSLVDAGALTTWLTTAGCQ